MKLNEKNYDEVILKIDASKMTDEMNTRVVVMTNSCRDSLAVKLYSILKREYAVLLTVADKEDGLQFPQIDYGSREYLNSFLIVYQIKKVIITSEFLNSLLQKFSGKQCMERICILMEVCRVNNIRLIYISVENLFIKGDTRYCFFGTVSQDEYNNVNKAVIKRLSEEHNCLIIAVSTVYGSNEYMDVLDFPEFVYETAGQGVIQEYDNHYIMYPVMMDEVAIYISEHFEKTGYFELLGDGQMEGITAYEWAIKALKVRKCQKLMKNVVSNSTQLLIDRELGIGDFDCNSFSDIETGYSKELQQKTCIFQLIYKLSPLECFHGESVAKIRIELGKLLAQSFPNRILENVDYVVPVPKTGLYYAMGLAANMGIPYIQALSKGASDLRSFQVNNTDVRKSIIRNKVIPIPELIEGKRLIVVDEAIFTGTTLKVICKILRECGVKEIFLGIPTPECYNQCTNYVQPKRAMLLEYVRRNMLEDYFEVEAVIFQNNQVFEEKMSIFNGACMDCFGGGGDNE